MDTTLQGERKKRRYPWLDAARGFALLHMIAYHASWDLVNLLGLDWAWFEGCAAFLWQQFICWSFILLSGFCWHLSRHALRHGVTLFACGLLVTVVTAAIMPEDAVWCGILSFLGTAALLMHCLHPLLRRCPPLLGALVSGALFALTRWIEYGKLAGVKVLPGGLYDGGLLGAFLGFPPPDFSSTDYFAMLPWIFLYGVGYFLFLLWKDAGEKTSVKEKEIPVLGWLGRRSLVIYLLHQPVICGMLITGQYFLT